MFLIKGGKTNIKYLLIVVMLAAVVGGGILAWQYWWVPREEAKNSQKPVACTQEAKVCPDGSAVGRTGPNCEFALCPDVKKDETAGWQTYNWNEISFKYPSNWTVEKIYYQTPAQQAQGESPENIGVRLFPGDKLEGNDFIAVGGRQVSCEPSQNHTKCSYISSVANYSYTDSSSTEILKIFDLFINTIKKNETADWQTYRNEEDGFEIKYPPLQEFYNSEEGLRISASLHGNSIYDISIRPNPENLSLKDFFVAQMENSRGLVGFDQSEIVSEGDVTLGEQNIQGKKIVWDENIITILISKENFIIEIEGQPFPSDEEFSDTFNQMLSTFRFLE